MHEVRSYYNFKKGQWGLSHLDTPLGQDPHTGNIVILIEGVPDTVSEYEAATAMQGRQLVIGKSMSYRVLWKTIAASKEGDEIVTGGSKESTIRHPPLAAQACINDIVRESFGTIEITINPHRCQGKSIDDFLSNKTVDSATTLKMKELNSVVQIDVHAKVMGITRFFSYSLDACLVLAWEHYCNPKKEEQDG